MTPDVRQTAAQLYGTPDEGAHTLGVYTAEQLEFLLKFLRRNVAYQEERMRRLETLKAREPSGARAAGRDAGPAGVAESEEIVPRSTPPSPT